MSPVVLSGNRIAGNITGNR